MGAFRGASKQSQNGKKYLSKNKSIKLYKEKQSKIQLFKEEVEALKKKYDEIVPQSIEKFEDFPLSKRTQKGLKKADYLIPTEIQKESIGLALKGHDILGAAKTGSGKTLAFVIPMLECLYCAGWTIMDGLGAIVITPTRELAYQIFEVLNKVGVHHHFSIALVIGGGTDPKLEKKVLDKCNILICTPGRLLQHMDQSILFDAANLKMLILDEADRLLELGFEKTVNAILENLPTERQTILFSATQTRSVNDLVRLSLKDPVFVSVHEHAKHSTPEGLTQNYLECEAHFKINLLWSFIKSHKQQKILVFLSCCKQVKFMYESFVRLKPHVEILALYGHLSQFRRMQIYNEFCRKNHVVMFATDVASRGLDFPNVNWVVQLDCPEDTNTYIHRAGRTARYQKNGKSLLVLLPSEKPSMIEQLKNRKIPIEEQEVDPKMMYDVRRKLEALVARDVELKNSAIRAFKSYFKTVYLMKDKTVFDVNKINVELYAKSLGLTYPPRLRFIQKRLKDLENKLKDQMKKTQCVQINSDSDNEPDDDLLMSKETPKLSVLMESDVDEPNESKKPITKAAVAKRVLKKKIKANTVVKFDKEGNPIREVCGKVVPVVASEIKNQIMEEGYSIEKATLIKEKEEEVDKILYRERVKQKHREERLKMKNKRKKEQSVAPQLAEAEENEEGSDSGSDIDPNRLLSESYNDVDRQEEESDDDSAPESPDSESEEELQQNGKRRKKYVHQDVKRQMMDNIFQSSKRSLDDDEQLALHFLTNT